MLENSIGYFHEIAKNPDLIKILNKLEQWLLLKIKLKKYFKKDATIIVGVYDQLRVYNCKLGTEVAVYKDRFFNKNLFRNLVCEQKHIQSLLYIDYIERSCGTE